MSPGAADKKDVFRLWETDLGMSPPAVTWGSQGEMVTAVSRKQGLTALEKSGLIPVSVLKNDWKKKRNWVRCAERSG